MKYKVILVAVLVVILLFGGLFNQQSLAGAQTQDHAIQTKLLVKSGDTVGNGIEFKDGLCFERYMEWTAPQSIHIVGILSMIDVDPMIGYMNKDVLTKGRIMQEIGGGRSAMTIEVSRSPNLRDKNASGDKGSLFMDRVSVVVVNDFRYVTNATGDQTAERYSMIYGVNTNTEVFMFPTGCSALLCAGEKLYVHMDVVNAAMSKGFLMPTVKIILYYYVD